MPNGYFEAHLTLRDRSATISVMATILELCEKHGAKIANIVGFGIPSVAQADEDGSTIITMREDGDDQGAFGVMKERLLYALMDFEQHGVAIRRYKIEKSYVDSNISDFFGVFDRSGPAAGDPQA